MIKLSPHNLGIYNGKIIIFDFHAVVPIVLHKDQIDNERYRSMLTKNIIRYTCDYSIYSIYNELRKKNKEKDFCHYIEKKTNIPERLRYLIKYLIRKKDKKFSKTIVLNILEEILDNIGYEYNE